MFFRRHYMHKFFDAIVQKNKVENRQSLTTSTYSMEQGMLRVMTYADKEND